MYQSSKKSMKQSQVGCNCRLCDSNFHFKYRVKRFRKRMDNLEIEEGLIEYIRVKHCALFCRGKQLGTARDLTLYVYQSPFYKEDILEGCKNHESKTNN